MAVLGIRKKGAGLLVCENRTRPTCAPPNERCFAITKHRFRLEKGRSEKFLRHLASIQ